MSFLRKLCRPTRILYSSRRCRNHEPIDEPIDEQFHMLPMGKSDTSMQTRVSFLSKDMNQDSLVGVRTISSTGFRLMDGQFLFGPIALFPKTVLSWRVLTVDDITPESLELFFVLQPKLDLLIVGVGDHCDIDKVRKRLAPTLAEHKIPYEILSTEFAIPTFNYMNSEGRFVGAALFPPDDIVVSRYQYGKALNIVRDYFEGEFNPLLMGLNYTSNTLEDATNRLFEAATPEERETALKRARELRDFNREQRQAYFKKRRETVLIEQLEDEVQVRKRWNEHLARKKEEEEKAEKKEIDIE